MRTCPHCGCVQHKAPAALQEWAETTKLPNSERIILRKIVSRYPRVVPVGDIVSELWTARNEPAEPEQVAFVYISKLRAKMKGSGWKLRNSRHQGYTVESEVA